MPLNHATDQVLKQTIPHLNGNLWMQEGHMWSLCLTLFSEHLCISAVNRTHLWYTGTHATTNTCIHLQTQTQITGVE